MMMEEYYGFSQNKSGQNESVPQRSYNKTQKSNKNTVFIRKSPNVRTLKRTQLSKQKLHSRDSKKQRRLVHPQLNRHQTIKQSQSGVRVPLNQNEGMQSNRQQMEVIVKKYDHYNNINSYQFKQPNVNAVNSSQANDSQNYDNYNQRGYRFQKEIPNRRPRYENHDAIQQQTKNYRSLSRSRNEDFLTHFQRQEHKINPIERYVQNHSNNDIRAKKSRSLGAKLRPYKMHTFYNAQKRQYYNYNEQGYMTDRQYELLNRIEEKALRAFQRANVQSSARQPPQPKKEKPQKQFEIEQTSKIRHRNSRILAELKRDSSYEDTPLSSRKQSVKNIKQQKVINLSIHAKKPVDHQYDDYEMRISSKNEGNKAQSKDNKQIKKDMFQHFARQQSINDSSLLQFKPNIVKQQKINEAQDLAKKSSQISNDYKSIDMMEINSNYKPTNKQLKQRNDFVIEDNRSLGMDTIKNYPINKVVKEQQQVEKNSNKSNSELSLSKSSNSSASIQSSSIQQSKNISVKRKQSNNQSKVDSEQKLDFAKNKMKKSYSMSQAYSDSSIHDNIKKTQKAQLNKDIVSNFKKPNPLIESQRLGSSNSISLQANNSSNNSQKIKIKRLVKQSNKTINQSASFSSNQPNMGALGVQSFANYEKLEPIGIKINGINKSKISERSPISEMQPSINNIAASRLKQKPSNTSFNQRSQASVSNRSRMRGSNYNSSNVQYDLFGEIRDFLQEQQSDYNEIRRAKQVRQLISDELDDVLAKIEDHLYILNCITEIILLVPEVYDFQTIYDKSKDWIFFQVFLTLKKYIFQRNRVIIALKGGRNCFNLLNYIIEDNILKKYLSRVQVTNILFNLEECNLKLDRIINQFYSFLIKFNHQRFGQNPLINLRPFRMNEDLVILLTEYIEQVQTLSKKKAEQFNEGEISPDDEEQYNIMMLLNERIFRLMEMTFIMANLGGKEIKAYEKEEDLFQDQSRFKTYVFQNQELFKQTVKYFR